MKDKKTIAHTIPLPILTLIMLILPDTRLLETIQTQRSAALTMAAWINKILQIFKLILMPLTFTKTLRLPTLKLPKLTLPR